MSTQHDNFPDVPENIPGVPGNAVPADDGELTGSELLPDESSSDGSVGGNDSASGGAADDDIPNATTAPR